MKRNWICGIDLGSQKLTGAIGRVEGETLSLFAVEEVESHGIAKGVVTDLASVSSTVKELVDRLEYRTKLRLEGTLLAINGSHLECLTIQGKDLISEKGKEITPREVRHVLQEAQSLSLPMNRQLLHVLLQGYVVDGQEGIRNPIGMYATRLRVQLKAITGVSTFVQNAVTCVNRAGLEVEGVVFSGYATALAVLKKQEKNTGCGFLEVGEGTSSLLLFQGGGIADLKIFPLGGNVVTEAVADRLRIPFAEAETLKKQQGSLILAEREKDHELLVSDGSRQKMIRKGELYEGIQEGVNRFFQQIRKDLKEISFPNNLLILAGGAALLEGMDEAIGSFFKCRSRLGKGEELHSSKSVPFSSATAIGLIRYGHEKQKEEKLLSPEGPVGKVFMKVKELFLDYF